MPYLDNINLPPVVTGETWSGMSVTITSSDDTKYADTLTRVIMSFKDQSGAIALNLDSDDAGEITINTATAFAWAFTVEPRLLTIAPSFYTWAIQVNDSGNVVDKDWVKGTLQVIADPHV